ncbi:ASCH domain-containing protein [Massilia genomosp. 1]|uniref:ASCH domain-containing protein n=1 Tax=Massilia genomosp. 1 TaxID=2609280 RepID=UPI001E433761|nr:ASCH domain-containing protein [Massilia genomosp. 1]
MNRLKRLTFWGVHDDDDSLPRSVMEGRKTVTAEILEEYGKPYGDYGDGAYEPGDLIEVDDLRQRLRCTIKATTVLIIEFGNIPEEVWRGENLFERGRVQGMPRALPAAPGLA